MDVFSTKSNSTSMKIDYFGQKKWKSQITHCGQNVKLDLQKTFIPPIYNTTFLREMSKTIRRLKKKNLLEKISPKIYPLIPFGSASNFIMFWFWSLHDRIGEIGQNE